MWIFVNANRDVNNSVSNNVETKLNEWFLIFYMNWIFFILLQDVQRLVENLPNVKPVYKIKYSKFNHIDYLWGCDAKTLLYNEILQVLEKNYEFN